MSSEENDASIAFDDQTESAASQAAPERAEVDEVQEVQNMVKKETQTVNLWRTLVGSAVSVLRLFDVTFSNISSALGDSWSNHCGYLLLP